MSRLSVWAPAAGRVDVEVAGRAAPMAPVAGRRGLVDGAGASARRGPTTRSA